MIRKVIVKMVEGKILFYLFEFNDYFKLILIVFFVISILGNVIVCVKILMKSWCGIGYFY